MDLSDLINKLGSVTITTLDTDDIIKQIINYMYESAEVGQNDYTYYFNTSTNVNLIIEKLLTYFPDLNIQYTPNNNYIFIDWS
jgi:hypothetical protein